MFYARSITRLLGNVPKKYNFFRRKKKPLIKDEKKDQLKKNT